MLCIGPQVCAIARPTGRCKHRPLRSTGQGSAGLCRISPSARRQCTPQSAPCGASSSPYRGAFQAAAPRKASPARGGAAAGGGGVRRLALPLPFRTAAACVGADALHRPASLRHRKAPRDDASIVPYEAQGRVLPGFAGYLPPQGGNAPLSLRLAAHPAPLTGEPFKRQRPAKPPLQGKVPPQRKNSPAPGLWVRGCFAGMRAGRLGVSGRRIPGCLSPKQRLPVWRAGHRRRHRAATADAAPPEFVPPPRCRPPAA